LSLRAVSDFAEPDGFARVVEPLELAVGKVLEGEGRALCLRAFETCPRGFALLAASALRDARNPLSLLIWQTRRRHHERLEQAAVRAEQPRRSHGACAVCGSEGLLVEYVGRLWCDTHYGEQRAFDGDTTL
jgi:hypothetical protein